MFTINEMINLCTFIRKNQGIKYYVTSNNDIIQFGSKDDDVDNIIRYLSLTCHRNDFRRINFLGAILLYNISEMQGDTIISPFRENISLSAQRKLMSYISITKENECRIQIPNLGLTISFEIPMVVEKWLNEMHMDNKDQTKIEDGDIAYLNLEKIYDKLCRYEAISHMITKVFNINDTKFGKNVINQVTVEIPVGNEDIIQDLCVNLELTSSIILPTVNDISECDETIRYMIAFTRKAVASLYTIIASDCPLTPVKRLLST